jgi:hypothetical protein
MTKMKMMTNRTMGPSKMGMAGHLKRSMRKSTLIRLTQIQKESSNQRIEGRRRKKKAYSTIKAFTSMTNQVLNSFARTQALIFVWKIFALSSNLLLTRKPSKIAR